MSCIHIQGGHTLSGEIDIQGAKNAALPIMAASILNHGVTRLYRCPKIKDVFCTIDILRKLGVKVEWESDCLILDATHIKNIAVTKEDTSNMRSSILFLGAMIGREKEVTLSYPGGCTIGERPIDWHIQAMKQLGVEVVEDEDTIHCKAQKLRSSLITLPYPSVGVTENIILASVLSDDIIVVQGVAREPEIEDLCQFLNAAGAKISGIGTDQLWIQGVDRLHDLSYTIMADRIVAATYMAMAAATSSAIIVRGISIKKLQAVANILMEAGCGLIIYEESIKIVAPSILLAVKEIQTQPYPGFPTDMQSQMMACMCVAYGKTCITENIFENRYKIVPELMKMGANIEVNQKKALIRGTPYLHAATVTAEDLRGGAALILAGLAADGETIVINGDYIERGYADICADLNSLGAHLSKQ